MFVKIKEITINTATIQCYYVRGRDQITETEVHHPSAGLIIEFGGADNWLKIDVENRTGLKTYIDLLDRATNPIEK